MGGDKNHHPIDPHDKHHPVDSHHQHHTADSHDKHHPVDHHDHHEEHHTDDHQTFQVKPWPVEHIGQNDPLNFTKKHPVFEINLDKKGPEFSTLDDLRADFIRKYAGKIPYTDIPVPKNIPGLIPRTGPLPSNRKLWKRPTSSLERNGVFNILTPNFTYRVAYPVFFVLVLYGWWGHATYGWYKARYEDNDEIVGNFYDKLNTRKPPEAKIWLRPG